MDNDLPPPVPASHLPRSICAFDIETAKTTLRKPEGCEIACAGVLVYKRVGSSWREGDYRWFGAGELPELEKFLRGFSGLIIGYNVFDFDYRVLRPHIPLEGIVEKTVDLRLVLDSLHSSRNVNLKLASLARINLMRRKLHDSRKMPALWRAGKRQFVFSHNKRDCELTAELWMHLLRQRGVYAGRIAGVGGPDWLTLTPEALAMLAGRVPQLTCPEWLARIEQWGNAVHPPNYRDKKFVEEPNLGRHPLFHRLGCGSCGRSFILVTRRNRWFRRDEMRPCPFCARAVPLQRGRVTFTLVWQRKSLGKCTFGFYPQPSRVRARYFPDPKTARSWINRLRIGSWW
jgi:hypothetical protein